MAQSCFLPASPNKYKSNSFSEKILCCGSVKTFLCCHLEFFFFYGSGCKGDQKVPLLSQMQGGLDSSCIPLNTAVSLAKSHFWIVASLSHR